MRATLPSLPNIAAALRFGAVGIVATVTYFLITNFLGKPPVDLGPLLANTAGVAVSLLVSYLGHHRYTFRVQGAHTVYLPRFIAVTGVLFVMSTAVMAAGRYIWHVDHTLVTAAITVGYPIASYVLNFMWTFAPRGR